MFLICSCQGEIVSLENSDSIKREEFRHKLKEEWALMWRERFDDRVKAEGIAIRDYPSLFMDRGFVIFASRDSKTPSFSEIVDFWASQGLIYSPNASVGGWGKFIRTELRKSINSRAKSFDRSLLKQHGKNGKQQLKKGGRGWLHRK
jgi:hypothetical protein